MIMKPFIHALKFQGIVKSSRTLILKNVSRNNIIFQTGLPGKCDQLISPYSS